MFFNHLIIQLLFLTIFLITIMPDASVKIGKTLVKATDTDGSMIYLGTFF
jgi:hypothetical protein